MTQLAFIDLAKLLDDAGFPAGAPQANGIAIVCAESARDPNARYVNTDGSVDRGLWEINDRWHPEVTDAQAYDPVEATKAALRISKGGTDYTPWSTWQNGSYRPHLEAARVALDALSRIKKQQTQLAAAQADAAARAAQVIDLQAKLVGEVDVANGLQAKIAAAVTALS